jgi:SAM-dependent methyltransferase
MLSQPTFRDPDGSCFRFRDKIYRQISKAAERQTRDLLSSPLVAELTTEGLLPRTRVLACSETDALRADLGGDFPPEGGLILEHETIRFVSYAHEWAPEMLHAAAQLTIELQIRAQAAGLMLKDATPANVLFRGVKPIFVDLLSLVPRPAGATVWPAYAQFVRTFVLPLLLYRQQGVSPREVFLVSAEGLEPETVHRHLSTREKFPPLALKYASIPSWLGHRKPPVAPAAVPARKNAVEISQMIMRSLARDVQALRPRPVMRSEWLDYMRSHSYSPGAFAQKEAFVRSALMAMEPKTVLDVGCNTGRFCEIAEELGAEVVGLDVDVAVVGHVFRQFDETSRAILPLNVNFARPSPGLGWRNAEQMSFADRARGYFDAALLLAVIHHLAVSEGIPLREIFRTLAEMVRRGVIVEFVPPEDEMFARIVRNREHLIERSRREHFEAAFAPWFRAERCEAVTGSGRMLYALAKLPG